jgi:hypothetical protein
MEGLGVKGGSLTILGGGLNVGRRNLTLLGILHYVLPELLKRKLNESYL